MILKFIASFSCVFLLLIVHGQHYSDVFFEGVQFAYDMDTLSIDEFSEEIRGDRGSFAQPLFTYGYDDPSDWSMILEAIEKTPHIVRPLINHIDLNGDSEKDIVISFLAGHEYSFVGFYLASKKGYKHLGDYRGEFYGVYEASDLLYRVPACCDDPTMEFYRLSISDGELTEVDSLSIASSYLSAEQLKENSIFSNEVWVETNDTLYATSTRGRLESFGMYLPGSRIREISSQTYEGTELIFCEVMGELGYLRRNSLVYGHSFVWLSKEEHY